MHVIALFYDPVSTVLWHVQGGTREVAGLPRVLVSGPSTQPLRLRDGLGRHTRKRSAKALAVIGALAVIKLALVLTRTTYFQVQCRGVWDGINGAVGLPWDAISCYEVT